MEKGKNPESSITQELIDKVHITLANFNTGEDMLTFLRDTEPIFMREVSRFVQTEMSRFKLDLPHTQNLYLGSVIGAAYISGFLIAREAHHKMFNSTMSCPSPIASAIKMTSADIDKLIDKYRAEGKSYKEIGNCIRRHLNIKNKQPEKNSPKKNDRGKRLDLEGLDK